jgi:crotonobetainyl-CoA:carnitine CoA-transferase CaiB-like acyl-CoA transferase
VSSSGDITLRTRTILAAAAIPGVALLGPTTGAQAGHRPADKLTPAEVWRAPPLGEHTEEVFRTVLGFGDQEIAAAPAGRELRRGLTS